MKKRISVAGVIVLAVTLILSGCIYIEVPADTPSSEPKVVTPDDDATGSLSIIAYAQESFMAHDGEYASSLAELIARGKEGGGINFSLAKGVRATVAASNGNEPKYLLVAMSTSGTVFYRTSEDGKATKLGSKKTYLDSPPLVDGIINPTLE